MQGMKLANATSSRSREQYDSPVAPEYSSYATPTVKREIEYFCAVTSSSTAAPYL